jgi:hypothetical protein
MTVSKTLLALALALVPAGLSPARADAPKPASKLDVAKRAVTSYAYEAYPSWAAEHPDKDCPAKLEDLNSYMPKTDGKPADGKDPWGQTYKLGCGKTLPPGVKGIAISSAGPDGKFGTADDITSWE